MKKYSHYLFLLCTLGLFLFILFGYSSSEKTKHILVAPMHGSFDIDPAIPNELVGFADNVFVGYVEKLEGTEYKFPVTIETEGETKEVSKPYTNYSVTVVDNIKGKLKKNNAIPMQKAGGISEEEDLYLLFEDDFLPEEGKYYIFSTFTQPDGSLLISGPNSNIALNAENKSEIVSSDNYKKYSKAVENEIKSNRERFKSNYSE